MHNSYAILPIKYGLGNHSLGRETQFSTFTFPNDSEGFRNWDGDDAPQLFPRSSFRAQQMCSRNVWLYITVQCGTIQDLYDAPLWSFELALHLYWNTTYTKTQSIYLLRITCVPILTSHPNFLCYSFPLSPYELCLLPPLKFCLQLIASGARSRSLTKHHKSP